MALCADPLAAQSCGSLGCWLIKSQKHKTATTMKYEIRGRCQKTGESMTLVVNAESADDAMLRGHAMGVEVSGVSPVTVEEPVSTPPDLMKYEIRGVYIDTGNPASRLIDASCAADAILQGQENGIEVQSAEPIAPSQVAKYEIRGHCQKTGELMTLVIKADSAAEATLKGGEMSIDVLSATPVLPNLTSAIDRELHRAQLETERSVKDLNEYSRTMKNLAWIGFIIFAIWLIWF